MMEKETVLVGLSGGVDSAAAAILLKQQGYAVVGATMLVWDPALPVPEGEYAKNACLSPEKEDITPIEEIARQLDIPFYAVDCRVPYRETVLANFRAEYAAGHTPNPCVRCNSSIKFGVLPAAAQAQGVVFDKFATGHYARVEKDAASGKYLLKRAVDLSRDQSYFLHRLNQAQLSTVLFPLGEKHKPEIREVAKQVGLAVHSKEDSQDFYCGDYNDLLSFPNQPGQMITSDGTVVGQHNGIWGYTIGKRKGLGLSGFKEPVYVVKILAAENKVVIGPKAELYTDRLTAKDVSWVSGVPPVGSFSARVKIRNLHEASEAKIMVLENGDFTARFKEPQLSVTAGQSAVIYDGEVVLGGGIIQ